MGALGVDPHRTPQAASKRDTSDASFFPISVSPCFSGETPDSHHTRTAMSFGRVLTAMVTPMRDDLSIDFPMVERLVAHLIETGSEGIVVTGTTGESPTLTTREKLDLYRAVRDAAGQRAKVIAGTGNY